MKKVVVLSYQHDWELERETNRFITEHNVIDIQFRMAAAGHNNVTYGAMIIYEE